MFVYIILLCQLCTIHMCVFSTKTIIFRSLKLPIGSIFKYFPVYSSWVSPSCKYWVNLRHIIEVQIWVFIYLNRRISYFEPRKCNCQAKIWFVNSLIVLITIPLISKLKYELEGKKLFKKIWGLSWIEKVEVSKLNQKKNFRLLGF